MVRELRQRANGFDCLMPGLCGVIGAAHIGRMRGYPELRRENMRILREALAGCPGLLLPRPADAATPAGQWLPLGVGQPAVARAVWAAVRDAGYVATCVPLPSGTCLEGHAATGEAGRACGPSGMVVALLIDVLSTSDDLHRLAEAIRERVDVSTAPQG